jgi:hypothetical protein
MAAKRVGCVGLALAAGMRGLLPLPRSENGKQRTQTQPKTPRSKKGRTRIGKMIGGCRCRRRRGNGNAEWQDGEMMTRAISILQASFDASLGRTIGGAS